MKKKNGNKEKKDDFFYFFYILLDKNDRKRDYFQELDEKKKWKTGIISGAVKSKSVFHA